MSLHRRVRAEDGQSTVEWLGVAFVVIALVIALAAFAGPMGDRVGEAFTCLVSRVTGDGAACTTGAAQAPGEPDFACVVRSSAGSVDASVRIAVVELGGGDAYVREEMSDGTIRITFIEGGRLGVSAEVGLGGSVTLGAGGLGAEAEAEVGANVHGKVGETVVFTDPAEADQFIQDRVTDEAIEALPPVISQGASGIRWIIDTVTGHETPQGDDGGTQASVGIGLEAEVEGTAGPARAAADALAEAGAQVQWMPDGSMDVTIRASQTTTGAISLILGGSGTVGGGGSVTVSVAPDGTVTAVSVSGQVEVSGSAGLVVLPSIEGLDDELGSLLGGSGGRHTVTARLDLTDPALSGTADGVRQALRDIGSSEVDGEAVVGAVADLVDGLAEASTVTVVSESVDRFDVGVEGSASAVVGLGAEVTADHVTTAITTAHYWDPIRNRFVPWISCTG